MPMPPPIQGNWTWRQPKAASERTEQIKRLPCPDFGQELGAPTDYFEDKLQSTVAAALVNGDWASQQRIKGRPAGDHGKLAWSGLAGNQRRVQGQTIDGGRQPLY